MTPTRAATAPCSHAARARCSCSLMDSRMLRLTNLQDRSSRATTCTGGTRCGSTRFGCRCTRSRASGPFQPKSTITWCTSAGYWRHCATTAQCHRGPNLEHAVSPPATMRQRAVACIFLLIIGTNAAATECPQLKEITVTARKQSEALGDVPLAIHVIDGGQLGERGIDSPQSLAGSIPGLYFEAGWGGEGSAPVLRGQAQPSQAGDNVGVFVDGVYQSNSFGVDASMLDLERIEVVEGPQSALYGHSTFAGAINYVTRRPIAEPQWMLAAQIGDRDYRGFSAVGSGPLGETGLLARLAASVRDSGGTGLNLAQPDQRLGGYRKSAVALTLANAVSQQGSLRLQARYSRDASTQPAVLSIGGPFYDCGS